jgi:ketosteroid isomerase-like protein
MVTKRIAMLVGIVVLVSCQRNQPPGQTASTPPDTVALRATLQRQAAAFSAAVLNGNADSVASYTTVDLVLLEPGLDVRGRDAFRALIQGMAQTTEVVGFVLTPETYVYATGHVAEFGRYRETYRDKKSRAETICDCAYAFIWTRDTDGVWRLSRAHAGLQAKP